MKIMVGRGADPKKAARRKPGRFELVKRIILEERAQDFEKICMQFIFKDPEPGRDIDTIYFAKDGYIIALNFLNEQLFQVVQFEHPLAR